MSMLVIITKRLVLLLLMTCRELVLLSTNIKILWNFYTVKNSVKIGIVFKCTGHYCLVMWIARKLHDSSGERF